MTTLAARIERIKATYDGCFGCGRANDIGLQLDDFTTNGVDEASVTFVPRDEYRGFSEMLHGGIVATALDETLAWTAMLLADSMVVTAKLELRFRNPATPGEQYTVVGRIVERRGKRLLLSGRITDAATGAVIAEADGLFVVSAGLPGSA